MTIDPRWAWGLNLLLGVLGFLVGASGLLTDAGWDALTVKHFVAYAALLLGMGNVINSVLSGIPSKDNTTGFLIKGPPKP